MTENWLGIYLRGVAMGAADLVPGVSGGTIALITGIYDRFINAISSVGLATLKSVLTGKLGEAWTEIDGNFLVVLGAGIATAIVSLASILNYLMTAYPLPLWSTFCGLVLASAIHLVLSMRGRWQVREYCLLVFGIGCAVFVGLTQAMQLPTSTGAFFLAGVIAISAMILPGISGSFLLLLMGMYQPIIAAVVDGDLLTLAVFAAGCVVGLMGFSRLLKALLARAQQATMATLYGFLLGSLVILWPWQLPVSAMTDRHGDSRTIQSLPVTPMEYGETVGDPMLLLCVLSFVMGGVFVRLLSSRAPVRP